MAKGPLLFDLEAASGAVPQVADAPVIDDAPGAVQGMQAAAMQTAAARAARKPSRLTRVFWGVALALVGALVSLAAWGFVTDLLVRYPLLGAGLAGLMALFLAVLALVALREMAAFGRLGRLDALRHSAVQALAQSDLAQARHVVDALVRLYHARDDTGWGRARLAELRADQLDATSLLAVAEAQVLAGLDRAATQEIEAAARQVATATALVPLALVDVAVALTANMRMIRRIAEIYGGRSGVLGSWRLMRAVLSHLVATGAVAVGDDMLEPLLGGSLVGKLSRRFGEGLVNGALTARVGVAAMDVCRPLPFIQTKRPSVRGLVGRSLGGLFGKSATSE